MLTYTLQPNQKVPLYEQLTRCIKEDISGGVLSPGEKLPGKRSLARNLGISVVTVETAYQQLLAEGYITSEARRGFFVADIRSFFPDAPGQVYDRLSHGKGRKSGKVNKSVSGNKQITEKGTPESSIIDSRKYLADFSANETSRENFPFTTWAKLSREELSEESSRLVKSSPGNGIPELREAIARHLWSFRGLNCNPENIVVGAGTEYLYSLLIQLLGFHKVYGIEDPGYRKLSRIYQSYGVNLLHIPLDRFGEGASALSETGADILHISPSHHFPTGRVMPIRERNEVLKWAAEREGRYIIEDDYDSEFRLVGRPIPALFKADPFGRVIYMNTFTKTLASTVRISYMVLPDGLMEQLNERLSFYSCTVSNFEQYTLTRFIMSGYFERHLNRMRNFYRTKRDRVIRILNESPLAQVMRIREEDAGLHFLLELSMSLSDAEFVRKASEKGVRISPLSAYYHNRENAPEHVFIVNYTSLSEEALPKAAEILAEIILKK